MISINHLWPIQEEGDEQPVDEGIVGDLAYSVGKRTPGLRRLYAKKPMTGNVSQSQTVKRAAAVMNNRLRM